MTKPENEDLSCRCTIQDICTQKDCECAPYCLLYGGQHMTTYTCVTISPDTRNYGTIEDLNKEWIYQFIKLSRFLEEIIIVLELANGIRPHYHLALRTQNKIALTQTLYTWSKYNNVKRHPSFIKGWHYMFKQVDTTYEATGIDPIYDRTRLNNIKEDHKKEKKQALKEMKHKEQYIDEPVIPTWIVTGKQAGIQFSALWRS